MFYLRERCHLERLTEFLPLGASFSHLYDGDDKVLVTPPMLLLVIALPQVFSLSLIQFCLFIFSHEIKGISVSLQ